jgi:LuxR family maltose regulon positive regulatory protein
LAPPVIEPRAAAARRVPANLPRGKLAPPHCEFEPVLPRAAEVLARSAVLAKLVTVCAPVGYGKTVFLGHLHQTLRGRDQRCLWVTLDDRDTAVNSLLFLIAAALRLAGEPLPDEQPAPEPMDDPRASLDRLLSHLAQLAGATVLFIDNLSFCTDPQLAPLLERLVFGSGPRLRLVLSGVDALPLDSTRAKLELGAVELRAAQLALDPASTALLFEHAGLSRPSGAALARIQTQTEGWPAAVRLLQVLMAQAPEQPPAQDEVLDRFNGDDHDIAAVLTQRVLAGFDPRLVQFMIEMALVREFSVDLAAHMTGQPAAGDWLALLLQRNVLVFPLDPGRRWLRMHTLLRQYLLAEGRHRLGRDRRHDLLERAARWHAEQGDDIGALEAALDAPAISLASQMLDRVSRVVVGDQGRLNDYIRWVEQLLSTGAPLSIEAHTWYVWALCFSLQYEQAHRAMDTLDQRLAEVPPTAGHQERLRARLGLLRVVVGVHLDTPDIALREAQSWLADGTPRDALSVATVATGAAVASLARGDTASARRFMQTAGGAVERSESAYGHAWVALTSAAIELTEGSPLVADRLLVAARQRTVKAVGEDTPIVASMDFVHARALLDLGRQEAARDRALRGLARVAHHGVSETTMHGLCACVALWNGEADGPFALAELDAVARRYPPRVQRLLAMQQVRRLLQLDRHDEAFVLASRHLLELPEGTSSEQGGAGEWTERLLVGIALMMARGHGREALARIDEALKALQGKDRPREVIELHLLAAELHVNANRLRLALRSLTLALLAVSRRRLVRPFHERLATVGRILSQAGTKDFGFTQPEELALLDDLRDACRAAALADAGASSPPPARPAAPASPSAELSPLTPRELQLLELVDLGLGNQLIADRVSLTVPTVKWHLYNLYVKLQVKSRAAALAKARSLHLLSR